MLESANHKAHSLASDYEQLLLMKKASVQPGGRRIPGPSWISH
jgi:hypothetical protein